MLGVAPQNAPPEPDSAQQPADEGPESEEVCCLERSRAAGSCPSCLHDAGRVLKVVCCTMQDDHEDIENELGIEVTKEADEDEEEKSEAGSTACMVHVHGVLPHCSMRACTCPMACTAGCTGSPSKHGLRMRPRSEGSWLAGRCRRRCRCCRVYHH